MSHFNFDHRSKIEITKYFYSMYHFVWLKTPYFRDIIINIMQICLSCIFYQLKRLLLLSKVFKSEIFTSLLLGEKLMTVTKTNFEFLENKTKAFN